MLCCIKEMQNRCLPRYLAASHCKIRVTVATPMPVFCPALCTALKHAICMATILMQNVCVQLQLMMPVTVIPTPLCDS